MFVRNVPCILIAFMKATTHGKQGVWEQRLFNMKEMHEKEHTANSKLIAPNITEYLKLFV